jgi:hypothetical protein
MIFLNAVSIEFTAKVSGVLSYAPELSIILNIIRVSINLSSIGIIYSFVIIA